MRLAARAVVILALVALTAFAAPKLKITTTSLPPPVVGSAYMQTLSANGGDPPLRWALATGALPKGLMLSPAGAITGTPTGVETAIFTVRVTDSGTDSDTGPFSLTV